MPRLSGQELAERLLMIRPDIRILYMSGYTDRTVVQSGKESIGGDLLKKPFSPDVLVKRVHEALEGARDRPVT